MNKYIITDGMKSNFYTIISDHIDKVNKCANVLFDNGLVTQSFLDRVSTHDHLKFGSDEYVPYVMRTWLETVGEVSYGDKLGKSISDAIYHHITHSDHHPEYWSSNFNYNTYLDKVPCRIVSMPEECVVEMLCDWYAMGFKYGNSIKDWFDRTNGVRWIWDYESTALINYWMNVFSELSSEMNTALSRR